MKNHRSLIFVSHFPQKTPVMSGSFTKSDLQIQASYGSSPPRIKVKTHRMPCLCGSFPAKGHFPPKSLRLFCEALWREITSGYFVRQKLVALLRKITSSLRHPMGLRCPVHTYPDASVCLDHIIRTHRHIYYSDTCFNMTHRRCIRVTCLDAHLPCRICMSVSYYWVTSSYLLP